MAFTVPWNLVGLQVSGDVGDLTIYTDRFMQKVAFPRSPPQKPPSVAQAEVRARFKQAQADYMAQSFHVKQQYEDATLVLSLPLTGQNLWISFAMRAVVADIDTIRNQSGINFPNPTFV